MPGKFFHCLTANPVEQSAAEGWAEITGLRLYLPKSEELGQGEEKGEA